MAAPSRKVLLGVRIACAVPPPPDHWEDKYYGMQAFFTPVRSGTKDQEFLAAGDTAVETSAPAKPFRYASACRCNGRHEGRPPPRPGQWVTAPDNPFFARNLANRVWALRGPRPNRARGRRAGHQRQPTECSTRARVENKFDLPMIRTVTGSRVYQRLPECEQADEQNGSRAALEAWTRVLLDMVCQATGVREVPRCASRPGGPALGQQGEPLFPEAVRPPATGQRLRCRAPRAKHLPGAHLLNARNQAKLSHGGPSRDWFHELKTTGNW